MRKGIRRWRGPCAGLLFLAGLGASCTTPYVGELTDQSRARVYLLRGLWDVFSVGFDVLAQEVESDTVSALSMTGPYWPSVVDEIQSVAQASERRQRLVLVGHSYGADDAINLARALNERNVEIDLLILLDATNPGHIPPNVATCVHYYIPTDLGRAVPDIFAGSPVVPTPGNTRTVIVNEVFSPATFGAAARGTDHFNIESNAFLHSQIKALIDALAADG